MAKLNHWMAKTADRVEHHVRRMKGDGAEIICASGISPSGTIHMGNLREIMTVHLITQELLNRGLPAKHIHFWDDYDRFRKVPKGIPDSFAEHIGKPYSAVPDPFGEYPSYGHRYMKEFEASMDRLGIHPTYVRQSEAYAAGTYTEHVKTAMAHRERIFDILAQYQTLAEHEQSEAERRAAYYPFKVYCESCGKDDTEVTAYDADTATIQYSCNSCGHTGSFSLEEKVAGKLVWKVDWPMRWFHYRVDFEPGGEDHSTPGSSFTVGKEVIKEVFGYSPPNYIGYAFVGFAGTSKISSSAGTVAGISTSLDVIEPAIMRWLYIRRRANQSFTIDFGSEVVRLYDEWDKLQARVQSEKAQPVEQHTYQHCIKTDSTEIPTSEGLVPFRLLASAADITRGNRNQMIRIAQDYLGEESPKAEDLYQRIKLRFDAAVNWAENFLPEEQRTKIKETFDQAYYDSLDSQQQQGLGLLLAQMEDNWSLKGLTTLLYGVPKQLLGLPLDTKPTDELKALQRQFFVTIYTMIVGADTGPRLPTLFLSLGAARVRSLLGPG